MHSVHCHERVIKRILKYDFHSCFVTGSYNLPSRISCTNETVPFGNIVFG